MKLKLFLLISALFCTSVLNAKASITASFKTYHYPINSQVELVDLIYLRGNVESINDIPEIIINTSDHITFIDSKDIKSYLSNYKITWKGKNKIYPKSASHSKIRLFELSQKAKQCLADRLDQLGFTSKVSIKADLLDDEISISAKKFVLACEIINKPTKEKVAKTIGVKVKLSNDQKDLLSRTLWFDVELNLTILKSTRDIQKNDSISIEAFTENTRISKGLSHRLITSNEIINGKYVAKTNLARGSTLVVDDLIPTPLVFDSMPSTLIHKKNGFEVKLKVIAQKNGYLNDLIKVKVPSSNEMLFAKVTGNRELTLYEK